MPSTDDRHAGQGESFILCYTCQVISGCNPRIPVFKTCGVQCYYLVVESVPPDDQKVGHSTTHCGLSATINLNRRNIQRRGRDYAADFLGKSTGTCLTLKTTPKYVGGESRQACHRCGLCFPIKCLSYLSWTIVMPDIDVSIFCGGHHAYCRPSKIRLRNSRGN